MKYSFLILAGGKGTRLFPLSRDSYPKQFLKLFSGKTLLEETLIRLKKVEENAKIIILTSNEYKFLCEEIADSYSNTQVICEPEGKNTAPAIGYGFLNFEDDECVGIFPSDHYIDDYETFRFCLAKGFHAAETGKISLLGIKPDRPETGYGYIEIDREIQPMVFNVAGFKEKPDLQTAEKYIKKSDYYWNSGIFIMQKKVFFKEISLYHPEINNHLKIIAEIIDKSSRKNILSLNSEERKFIENEYRSMDPISFDYAVCEHSKEIVMIPCSFFWSDIGSFDAYYDYIAKNSPVMRVKENQFMDFLEEPRIISEDGFQSTEKHRNLVIGQDKDYIILGHDELIIVDTDDICLVCKKGESQKIKKIKQFYNGSPKGKLHTTCKRPWGIYTNIYEKEQGFKVKRIEVFPGQKLSLQLHNRREEHWIIARGEGIVQKGDEKIVCRKGDHVHIKKEEKHRIECTSEQSLIFIEVQLGDYLGEDDIIRIEDIYGRIDN